MTDQELLRRAARSAGYRIVQWDGQGAAWCVPTNPDEIGFGFWWSPLADDRDAFRLAVRLDISLRQQVAMATAEYPWTDGQFNTRRVLAEGVLGDDLYAAARRAIVRAAAAIGDAQ